MPISNLSYYDLVVTQSVQMLQRTSEILTKGEEWAKEKGITESQVMSTRLVEDQAALPYQIQRLSDSTKFAAVRIGNDVEGPKFEDNETTFAQLQDRLKGTIDFLQSIPKEKFDGIDDKEVSHPALSRTVSPAEYLFSFSIPNSYFHVTTAYAILRHQGAPVGKRDYLGRSNIPWKS